MPKNRYSVIPAILALLVLLSSCGIFSGKKIGDETVTDNAETAASDSPISIITDEAPVYVPTVPDMSPETGDGKFSLRYNKSATMNPLSSTDANNIQLAPLMYESLFILSESFEAIPVLSAGYETADGINWIFNIVQGVNMSDGRPLTAYDVVYSFSLAKTAARYKSRLKAVSGYSVISTTSFRVTLTKANYSLPKLLDFAIIRDGNTGSIPPGTGPYRYDVSDGVPKLVINTERAAAESENRSVPSCETIYLVECEDNNLGEYFTSLTIDLVAADPSGSLTAQIRRDHESRYYDTTILQFLGFSKRTLVLSDARVRKAIALSINRSLITDEYLGGRAVAAQLAFSPKSLVYDTRWEPQYDGNERIVLSEYLVEAGLGDYDNDTWLEYNTSGGPIPIQLKMIVSIENSARVYAARSIVETLRHIGLNVELSELTYASYKAALDSGSFDLFYGETRLPADFNISEFVLPGGSLNYGNVGGEQYRYLIDNYLASPDSESRLLAASALCEEVLSDTPFAPIAYLQYAVYSARGYILDMPLSPSGIFCEIRDWQFAE